MCDVYYAYNDDTCVKEYPHDIDINLNFKPFVN